MNEQQPQVPSKDVNQSVSMPYELLASEFYQAGIEARAATERRLK